MPIIPGGIQEPFFFGRLRVLWEVCDSCHSCEGRNLIQKEIPLYEIPHQVRDDGNMRSPHARGGQEKR